MATVVFTCKKCGTAAEIPTLKLLAVDAVRCSNCYALALLPEKEKLALIGAAVQEAIKAAAVDGEAPSAPLGRK